MMKRGWAVGRFGRVGGREIGGEGGVRAVEGVFSGGGMCSWGGLMDRVGQVG